MLILRKIIKIVPPKFHLQLDLRVVLISEGKTGGKGKECEMGRRREGDIGVGGRGSGRGSKGRWGEKEEGNEEKLEDGVGE